jgi:TPR repeat protein/superfamily I DNA/RNA helicase
MKVLIYNELNPESIIGFDKLIKYLENDDFKSGDVKKVGKNLYRARLNLTDRLLFSIYRYAGATYALILEYIKNHEYENSRFLRQVSEINDAKIPVITVVDDDEATQLIYLNTTHNSVNLLDKVISFDEKQQAVYEFKSPLVIIGSAGSGKTALTLEKMKQVSGDILYITQSAYLVKHSHSLYYANGYDNKLQQVDFLSFHDFLDTIKKTDSKPVTIQSFKEWFNRHRQSSQIKDPHKLFEEFAGVLTGLSVDQRVISYDDYLNLGVKQSIFLQEERKTVYDLFEKYLCFLKEQNLHDTNILSHDYLQDVTPRYDFVVVDEVQDLTNIQLYLILKSLHQPNNFILCGDSNQIVHPNFFSWSNIKSLFSQQNDLASDNLVCILNTNYRNTPQLTEIANCILKIKNLRFGSIDKESHYFITSNAQNEGEILFFQDSLQISQDLNSKTQHSTLFAVIVMNEEQKNVARKHFNTPLIFTIQEAKGLEYENIILYNFLGQEQARYREISNGVNPSDLDSDIKFSRAKDKNDKSFEVYKFYINSLYVGVTRAVKNLYWIESDTKHPMLGLLGLCNIAPSLQLTNQSSSLSSWTKEANKLELQGKQEQANLIRTEILKQKTPNWQVITLDVLSDLKRDALERKDKNVMMTLFEYALVYNDDDILNSLLDLKFKPAEETDKGLKRVQEKYYQIYTSQNPDALLKQLNTYGVNFRNKFNQTPLMAAVWSENETLINVLIDLEPDTGMTDNKGLSASQIVKTFTDTIAEKKHNAEKEFQLYLDCFDENDVQINQKALFWLTKSAEGGFSEAQNQLAGGYQEAKKDYKQALFWFKKAAEQGHLDAQNNLGIFYQKGFGGNQDYKKAMYWYEKAAEQGHLASQNDLGAFYQNGFGGTQNYKKAMYWYEKAAEQGNMTAQKNLANMFDSGKGTEKNYKKARYWYEKAAEQGCGSSQYNLGNIYEYGGDGVEKDYQKAKYWYEIAAENNSIEDVKVNHQMNAQFTLGGIYKNGKGVEKDYQKAIYWYEKAAKQGDVEAKYNIGELCREENNYEESFFWYKSAAEQGFAPAQHNLGAMYTYGHGVGLDYKKAIYWYEKAARQGYAESKDILSRLKG